MVTSIAQHINVNSGGEICKGGGSVSMSVVRVMLRIQAGSSLAKDIRRIDPVRWRMIYHSLKAGQERLPVRVLLVEPSAIRKCSVIQEVH